jgi:hypothetical protein
MATPTSRESHFAQATFPVTVGPDLNRQRRLRRQERRSTPSTTRLHRGKAERHGIAVDTAGSAYVTGSTTSTQATFPVTVGPDLTHNSGNDVFVAKVTADGTALDYCGYIGGAGNEDGRGIAVDAAGNA